MLRKVFAVAGVGKADSRRQRNGVLTTDIGHRRDQSFFTLNNTVVIGEWVDGRKHKSVSVYWLISVGLRGKSHCRMGVVVILMILNANQILVDREDTILNNIHVVVATSGTSMIRIHEATLPILRSAMRWTRTLFLYDFKLYIDIFVSP